MNSRTTVVGVVAVIVVCAVSAIAWLTLRRPVRPFVAEIALERVDVDVAVAEPDARTVEPYAGLGAWVDVFDYDPAYAGEDPPVPATTIEAMAESGVETVYLQAARLDDRTPDGLVDPWLLAEWILRAHAEGIAVVGWYLPEWSADDADLDRLRGVADFSVLGHRFDGLGVDIEWTGADLEHDERSARLVELTRAIDAATGSDPLGAIVLPPVLIEVVNDQFWPGFPWEEIAPSYDAWLPMAYWSFRSGPPYDDPYAYVVESVERLRTNIGDPTAQVHVIGGIGALDGVDDPAEPEEPLASIEDLARLDAAVTATDAIGVSLYDWNTTEPAAQAEMSERFVGS